MKKMIVKVCTGTTCFVMGASQLESLSEHLSPDVAECLDIQAHRCLGFCKDRNYGKAPFVTIDEDIVSRATLPELVQAIEARVRKRRTAEDTNNDL